MSHMFHTKSRLKPNFLGIGVPRAGTTWLHALLQQHPRIYVPTRRKEVHYFDRYHHRGDEWYNRFFPLASDRTRYCAVGEITPAYFYGDFTAQRVAQCTSVKRLLLMLRNPVDRLHSDYRWYVRNKNYRGDFSAYLSDRPDRMELGEYAKHLRKYFEYFDRNQILVFIMEEAVQSPRLTKETLCGFLGVDAEDMPLGAGAERVNESVVPRFRWLFASAAATRAFCRDHDFDFAVRTARAIGLKKLLMARSMDVPPMTQQQRRQLTDHYAVDIQCLSGLLGQSLDAWLDPDLSTSMAR